MLILSHHWVLDAPPRVVDRGALARAIFDALALPLPSRRLVFPARVEVDAGLVPLLERHRELMLAHGLETTFVGERDVALHTVPRLPEGLLSEAPPITLLLAFLDALRSARDPRRALRDALALDAAPSALAALDLHPASWRLLDAASLIRLFSDRGTEGRR